MKTVLIKDNHQNGNSTLASPMAKLGKQSGDITIKAIHEVPDDFPASRLCQLWNQTCDLTWLLREGDPMARGRFEFKFSELGEGRIIK